MHPIAELAKKAVEHFMKEGTQMITPEPLLPELAGKAGVFVCIKRRGELRGCIGTLTPSCKNIGEETVMNAVAAATKDHRFLPVRTEELEELDYSVDVLSCPEKVIDVAELDPAEYGVIVSSGHRRGLLLPALEGVRTVEEQIEIARMKAGIGKDEDIEIYKFRVERYT
jgi:AmmeMemoRadiSam system protein A